MLLPTASGGCLSSMSLLKFHFIEISFLISTCFIDFTQILLTLADSEVFRAIQRCSGK